MDDLENKGKEIGAGISTLPVERGDFDALRMALLRRFGRGQPSFEFLGSEQTEDAGNFLKGLVKCEEAGLTPGDGSVSPVIFAFAVLRNNFPIEEWAPIADWIIRNHRNPWSPSNFRKERECWEAAQETSSDPVKIARKAVELRHVADAESATRSSHHEIRQQISRLHKGSPPSPEVRQQIIDELDREAGWGE